MNNDNNPLFDSKPIAHIQALQDSLLEIGSVRKAKRGQQFPLVLNGERMCFSLIQGKCDIKRQRDSLLIDSSDAPIILGISLLWGYSSHFIIQAKNTIEYMYFSQNAFLLHVEKYNLWKQASYSSMYVTTKLAEYIPLNIAISSYESICNQLRALNDENFETRATTSALKYIQERTSLSRSGIMKTLSELNAGGYITIKRGILIKINKLPEKY
ncbi:helix-turn-helix domain-containing protein [Serratia fonticola]|uniref:helix-turn-helix domain-containing protein n=1 Tax=Serratia fonticola TaxID=47917 RepID=UPI0034C67586